MRSIKKEIRILKKKEKYFQKCLTSLLYYSHEIENMRGEEFLSEIKNYFFKENSAIYSNYDLSVINTSKELEQLYDDFILYHLYNYFHINNNYELNKILNKYTVLYDHFLSKLNTLYTPCDFRMGFSGRPVALIFSCPKCENRDEWMNHMCIGIYIYKRKCVKCTNLRISVQNKERCDECHKQYCKYLQKRKKIPYVKYY